MKTQSLLKDGNEDSFGKIGNIGNDVIGVNDGNYGLWLPVITIPFPQGAMAI